MANEPEKTNEASVISNGVDLPKNSALDEIFGKIEAGKAEGKETGDVIQEIHADRAEKQAEDDKKVIEAKEEVKEDKKDEPSDLEQRLGKQDEQKKEEVKEPEVTRDFLKKEVEHKEPEAKEDKKDDKKAEDEIPEDELKPLPHDKPRTVKRIEALLTKITQVTESEANTKKEVASRDEKLKELQAQLEQVKTVDPKTSEEVKSQLDELQKFRRIYELEKDPEVKTKYDSRIESSEGSIVSTLKSRNAGDALLGLIKEEGGWNKFAGSARQVTLADGKVVTASQLADTILSNLPLTDRKAIETAMIEQVQTGRDKERYFSEQKETALKYFKDREENQKKQSEDQQNQIKQLQSEIDSWYKDTTEKTEWLKEKTIPESATADQKKEIEESNKYTKQLNSLLKKSLKTTDVKEALQITFDSVQMFQERREKNQLLSEVKKLKSELAGKQGEIDKFRNASRSTPKGGTISPKADATALAPKKFDSLEATLNALSSGEMSRSEILSSANEE